MTTTLSGDQGKKKEERWREERCREEDRRWSRDAAQITVAARPKEIKRKP
jgi:hypothetical protein